MSVIYLVDTSLLSMEANISKIVEKEDSMIWFDTSPNIIVDLYDSSYHDIKTQPLDLYTDVIIITDLLMSKIELNINTKAMDKLVEEYSKFFKICKERRVNVTVKSIYSHKRLSILKVHKVYYNKFIDLIQRSNVRITFSSSDTLSSEVNSNRNYNYLINKLSMLYDIPIYYMAGIVKCILILKYNTPKSILFSVEVVAHCLKIIAPGLQVSGTVVALLTSDIINSNLMTYSSLGSDIVHTGKIDNVLNIPQTKDTQRLINLFTTISYRYYTIETIQLLESNINYNRLVECNRIICLFDKPEFNSVLLREISNIKNIEDSVIKGTSRAKPYILYKDLMETIEHSITLIKSIGSLNNNNNLNYTLDILNYLKYEYYKSKVRLLNETNDSDDLKETNELLLKLEEDNNRLTTIDLDVALSYSIIEN